MRTLFIILLLFLATPAWSLSGSRIEKLVKNAPITKSHEDLEKLVSALTQDLKDDEDKAYSILTWIVKNIDYDDYKFRQIEKSTIRKRSHTEIPDSGDILKSRLGVCGDIADLYTEMLEQAKLKAVTISGCAGEVKRRTRECKDATQAHAWNAVWIKDQWELVDPTWAITGRTISAMEDVSKTRIYERELKKRETGRYQKKNYKPRAGRSVDKHWFMTEPSVMQRDHQPYDEKWLFKKRKDRKNKNL